MPVTLCKSQDKKDKSLNRATYDDFYTDKKRTRAGQEKDRRVIISLKEGGESYMRPSKLNLIGRDNKDILREFQVLLAKIERGIPKSSDKDFEKVYKEAFNSDIDGWINWLESIKIK